MGVVNTSFGGEIYSYHDKQSNTIILTNVVKPKLRHHVSKVAPTKEAVEVLDNKWLYKQERQKLLQDELAKEQKLLASTEKLFNFIVQEKYAIKHKNIPYKELYDSVYTSILVHQKNIQLLKNQLE